MEKTKTANEIRQTAEKKSIIDQLKRVPIIQVACERAKVSRATFYRWRTEDKEFRKEVEGALVEGTVFINELSESQIITLIKEKNLPAIRLWLRHNDPKYAERIEIMNRPPEEALNPEQEEAVRRALELAALATEDQSGKEESKENNHGNDTKESPVSTPSS